MSLGLGFSEADESCLFLQLVIGANTNNNRATFIKFL